MIGRAWRRLRQAEPRQADQQSGHLHHLDRGASVHALGGRGHRRGQSAGFAVQLALWLWATVLFANVAESIAEGRGKAAADSLRATRVTTKAKLIVDPKTGSVVPTNASELEVGSIILVEAGDVIPRTAKSSRASPVNEAAITGESAPVIRESGGDRSAVTGGTTVVSDWIKVRVTAKRRARPSSTA
jgi:potassium-transporting ATPase ATP-binding subunit